MTRSSALLALLFALVVPACATVDADDAGEETEQTDQAYSGPVPDLYGTSGPSVGPRSWPQPESEGLFGKNGYCGATAAANTLAWYDRNVSPRQAIDDGCWSFVGTRPSHLAAYMQDKHAGLGCSYQRFNRNGDALAYVKSILRSGRPLMIEYMVGGLNAHWVTVVGVRGRGRDTNHVVMSDGGYYTAKWDTMNEAWKNGWGGPFPHVVCNARVPAGRAAGLTVE